MSIFSFFFSEFTINLEGGCLTLKAGNFCSIRVTELLKKQNVRNFMVCKRSTFENRQNCTPFQAKRSNKVTHSKLKKGPSRYKTVQQFSTGTN